MVYAASAVAFAVVALNVASGMAMPYDDAADLMERDYNDYELDAREYYNELDTRDIADIEARELLAVLSEVDAREYDGLDARELEEVFEYLRDVSNAAATPAPATITVTASASLQTITKTHTHHPKPTSCTSDELKAKKAAAKKAKADAKKAKADAKKAKEAAKKAAKKAKKLAAERRKHHHHHHHHHHHEHEHASSTALVSATASAGALARSASPTASASVSATPSASGTHSAQLARITPAPAVHVAQQLTTSTHTGRHGTVTVEVTTTAATPACTAPSLLKKLFKGKKARSFIDDEMDEMFAREYDFDDLD